MADLADLKAFDLVQADLAVWVFKKSQGEHHPVFTGRWVEVSDDLAAELRRAAVGARASITETIEYSILAQNNEGSALTLGTDETHMALIDGASANPTPTRKVTRLKEIVNSDFYALRFTSEGGTLMAVRKTDATWKTRGSSVRAVFADEQLDIDRRPSFSLDPFFDFFTFDESVFVSSKPRFESVLSYRLAHVEAFDELKVSADFADIFSKVRPIETFVGTNKIQLRRAIAIREKGHYRDAGFMDRLRKHSAAMNLGIVFDDDGRIVPSAESCRDIFQALLDHRLDSRLSQQLHDVQNTERVADGG